MVGKKGGREVRKGKGKVRRERRVSLSCQIEEVVRKVPVGCVSITLCAKRQVFEATRVRNVSASKRLVFYACDGDNITFLTDYIINMHSPVVVFARAPLKYTYRSIFYTWLSQMEGMKVIL